MGLKNENYNSKFTRELSQRYCQSSREKGLYPSRSELARVAIREFLIKELEAVKFFTQLQNTMPKAQDVQDNSEIFIQLPVDNEPILHENGDQMIKTYRIIKK